MARYFVEDVELRKALAGLPDWGWLEPTQQVPVMDVDSLLERRQWHTPPGSSVELAVPTTAWVVEDGGRQSLRIAARQGAARAFGQLRSPLAPYAASPGSLGASPCRVSCWPRSKVRQRQGVDSSLGGPSVVLLQRTDFWRLHLLASEQLGCATGWRWHNNIL